MPNSCVLSSRLPFSLLLSKLPFCLRLSRLPPFCCDDRLLRGVDLFELQRTALSYHDNVHSKSSFTLPETDWGTDYDSCPLQKEEGGILVRESLYEHVLHSTMQPSGLESESVSINVNERQELVDTER